MNNSKLIINPANNIEQIWEQHIDAYDNEIQYLDESLHSTVFFNYYDINNGMDIILYDITNIESGISIYLYWNTTIKYNPDIRYRALTIHESYIKQHLNDINWYFIYKYFVRMIYYTSIKVALMNEGISDI